MLANECAHNCFPCSDCHLPVRDVHPRSVRRWPLQLRERCTAGIHGGDQVQDCNCEKDAPPGNPWAPPATQRLVELRDIPTHVPPRSRTGRRLISYISAFGRAPDRPQPLHSPPPSTQGSVVTVNDDDGGAFEIVETDEEIGRGGFGS
eukprot:gene29177-12047_t